MSATGLGCQPLASGRGGWSPPAPARPPRRGIGAQTAACTSRPANGPPARRVAAACAVVGRRGGLLHGVWPDLGPPIEVCPQPVLEHHHRCALPGQGMFYRAPARRVGDHARPGGTARQTHRQPQAPPPPSFHFALTILLSEAAPPAGASQGLCKPAGGAPRLRIKPHHAATNTPCSPSGSAYGSVACATGPSASESAEKHDSRVCLRA